MKLVEERRKDPTLPQRYQSKPSKTGGLAGALIKKFINSMQAVSPMILRRYWGGEGHEGGDVAAGGVAVRGGGGHVGGGGDIRVREPVPRLSTRHDDRTRHLKQVLERTQAGTVLGEATEERWDEVLVEQGEVLARVSTARHHGLPSPPGQKMQGALFTQWTPNRRHSGVKPNTMHLDPPTPLVLKDCLRMLEWGVGEDVPTFGQLLLLGVGLEARPGLASRDVVDTVFSPPEVQPGPPVCTHHPVFLFRSAHGISPVTVREGELLLWNGVYEMEVVKADLTDGDAEVTWALGATLPPTRPAPAWRLLHAVPEWKLAKESKKGTCARVNVRYALFSTPYSREVRSCMLRIQICSFTNFSRSSRDLRANFT